METDSCPNIFVQPEIGQLNMLEKDYNAHHDTGDIEIVQPRTTRSPNCYL